MNNIAEKKLAMFEVVSHTANGITTIFKTMPRTGKKRRNIFVKSYNRRPQNKKKRALIMAQAAMTAVLGAMQLHAVMVRPIQRYQKGIE